MPASQFRGFDPTAAMDQFMQMSNFMHSMKERKRVEEDRSLKEQNPLVSALMSLSHMRETMGPDYEDNPEVMRQIMRLHKMNPDQQAQFQEQAAKLGSVSQQKRYEDFRKDLAHYQVNMQNQRQRNKDMLKYISKDPEMAKIFGTNFAAQEAESRMTHMNAIRNMYKDVLRNPDARAYYDQMLVDDTMGGPGDTTFSNPPRIPGGMPLGVGNPGARPPAPIPGGGAPGQFRPPMLPVGAPMTLMQMLGMGG